MPETWYWDAEHQTECCSFAVCEILDNYSHGQIAEIVYAKPQTMFCATLPAAIDSDSDDSLYFEGPRFEQVSAELDAELDRRVWCLSWGGI